MLPITIDLDPDDRTVMKNKVNKYINIHYTGNKTDTALNNAKYFKNGLRYASANYFVDAAHIVQIVRDSDAAWSVGKKYGNARLWGVDTNSNSINIEMCSTNGAIEEATLQNTAELTKALMTKYNIPIENVVRHWDVCAKRCPGWNGWLPGNESEWNRFLSKVQGSEAPEARQLIPQAQPAGVSGTLYKVTTDVLRVRAEHNTDCPIRGRITDHGVYTITEIWNNWGKLASGMGWICLDYCKKIDGATSAHVSTPASVPPAPVSTPSAGYKVGSVYTVVASDLIVRAEAAGAAVGYNRLTASGKKADTDHDGALNCGAQVTCKGIQQIGNNIWMHIPSGWVCAIQNGNVYIR
jgi:N-acetyl-anhydromuramyl-L-alanine amidase AmpD